MKISPKQEVEIAWICKYFGDGYVPTQEEKEQYISNTVLGVGKEQGVIEIAKRGLDITIKMWRNDIASGLFCINEYEGMMEDGYGDKVFKSIMSNLPNVEKNGFFLSNSIMWAIDRWQLPIRLTERAIEDYRDMKAAV